MVMKIICMWIKQRLEFKGLKSLSSHKLCVFCIFLQKMKWEKLHLMAMHMNFGYIAADTIDILNIH